MKVGHCQASNKKNPGHKAGFFLFKIYRGLIITTIGLHVTNRQEASWRRALARSKGSRHDVANQSRSLPGIKRSQGQLRLDLLVGSLLFEIYRDPLNPTTGYHVTDPRKADPDSL